MGLILSLIPVVNTITDLVNVAQSADVTGGAGGAIAKFSSTVMVLQYIVVPYAEKFTRSTANTWDDGLLAKAKMVIAFVMEIVTAFGAADPALGKRIRAISGKREK